MEYKDFLIKKDKLDLSSSIESLDKKVIIEAKKTFKVKTTKELKSIVIKNFKYRLKHDKFNLFKIHLLKLVNHENFDWYYIYGSDIYTLIVFIYQCDETYYYYIPTEIKEIILENCNLYSSDEEYNLDNAPTYRKSNQLSEIIKNYKMQELRNLAFNLSVENHTKISKKDLTEITYNILTNENKIAKVIENLKTNQLDLLKRLMSSKGIIQDNEILVNDYNILCDLNIAFNYVKENKFYIFIADEVYKTINKIDLTKFDETAKVNTKIYDLILPLTDPYGVISWDDLNYFYTLYYGECKFLKERISSLFQKENYIIGLINFDNNLYFINSVFDLHLDKAIIKRIIKNKNNVNRKEFSLNTLLSQSYNKGHVSFGLFKRYLEECALDFYSDNEFPKVINMLKKGKRIDDIISNLEINDFVLNKKEEKDVRKLLTLMKNKTIIFENYGWTLEELNEKE